MPTHRTSVCVSAWLLSSALGLFSLAAFAQGAKSGAAEADSMEADSVGAGSVGDGAVDDGSGGGEVVITEKARQHFRAGVNFLQDPDGARYEEAYQQFKLAYQESPSWKVLGNLGLSAMYLERDGEAIDAFERYLEEGGENLSPEERQQFERDLATLKAAVVTVDVTASVGGVRITDRRLSNRGATVTNVYELDEGGSLSIRIRPGNHTMVARVAGQPDQTWEFSATAAQTYEHRFDFSLSEGSAPSEPAQSVSPEDGGVSRPVPTSVWIGAGVTGALLIGTVTTGILALGKNGEYQDANQSGSPDAEDLRGQVQTLNVVTDVLLGATIVGAGVTTVLYFTRPEVKTASALRIDPLVGPGVAALSLSGRF